MCFQIVGDAVGWGFVVRGNRPCHIQAVEPCGPAAAAGMKVGIMGSVVLAGICGWICKRSCFSLTFTV